MASSANAAIPSVESICSGIFDRRARANVTTLVLEGVRKRSETDEHPVRVREWIRFGQGHRIELEDDTGKQNILVTRGLRFEWRDGQAAPKPTRARTDVLSLFVTNPSNVPEAVRFLAEQKIDVEEINLGRIGPQVAYVIGAKPWEREKNQLWVDKLFRAPLALLKVERAEGEPKDSKQRVTTETRWLEWGSGQTEDWYPRRVETLRNGTLVELTLYDRAIPNGLVEDGRLEPPR